MNELFVSYVGEVSLGDDLFDEGLFRTPRSGPTPEQRIRELLPDHADTVIFTWKAQGELGKYPLRIRYMEGKFRLSEEFQYFDDEEGFRDLLYKTAGKIGAHTMIYDDGEEDGRPFTAVELYMTIPFPDMDLMRDAARRLREGLREGLKSLDELPA